MRLYSRAGATSLDDPEYGHFDAGADGGFDLPEELGERLHRFHVGKEPLWETDIERQHRLMQEELERRKDPATLLDAVQQLVAAAKAVTPEPAPVPESTPDHAPKPTPAKKTAAKKATPPAE